MYIAVFKSLGRFGFPFYGVDQKITKALFIEISLSSLSLLTVWCFKSPHVHHSPITGALHRKVSVRAAGRAATAVQSRGALVGVVCGFLLGFGRYRAPFLPPLAQQILYKKRRASRWSGSPVVRRPVLHPSFDVTELLLKSPASGSSFNRALSKVQAFISDVAAFAARPRRGSPPRCGRDEGQTEMETASHGDKSSSEINEPRSHPAIGRARRRMTLSKERMTVSRALVCVCLCSRAGQSLEAMQTRGISLSELPHFLDMGQLKCKSKGISGRRA